MNHTATPPSTKAIGKPVKIRARNVANIATTRLEEGDTRPACQASAATPISSTAQATTARCRRPGLAGAATAGSRPISPATRISRAIAAKPTSRKPSGSADLTTNVKGSPCSATDRSPIVNDWATAAKPCQQSKAASGSTSRIRPAASIRARVRGEKRPASRSRRTWSLLTRQAAMLSIPRKA